MRLCELPPRIAPSQDIKSDHNSLKIRQASFDWKTGAPSAPGATAVYQISSFYVARVAPVNEEGLPLIGFETSIQASYRFAERFRCS